MRTAESRFWSRVDCSDGLLGCWLWMGSRDKYGYGRFAVDGRTLSISETVISSHRFAMQRHLGRVLDRSELVLHSCDNPPCVNPAHLRIGTHADNAADRVARGRQVNAERRRLFREGVLTWRRAPSYSAFTDSPSGAQRSASPSADVGLPAGSRVAIPAPGAAG